MFNILTFSITKPLAHLKVKHWVRDIMFLHKHHGFVGIKPRNGDFAVFGEV